MELEKNKEYSLNSLERNLPLKSENWASLEREWLSFQFLRVRLILKVLESKNYSIIYGFSKTRFINCYLYFCTALTINSILKFFMYAHTCILARLVYWCDDVIRVHASTSISAKNKYLQPRARMTEIKPFPTPLQDIHVV